jgi:hypothetical protein
MFTGAEDLQCRWDHTKVNLLDSHLTLTFPFVELLRNLELHVKRQLKLSEHLRDGQLPAHVVIPQQVLAAEDLSGHVVQPVALRW